MEKLPEKKPTKGFQADLSTISFAGLIWENIFVVFLTDWVLPKIHIFTFNIASGQGHLDPSAGWCAFNLPKLLN